MLVNTSIIPVKVHISFC